MKMKRILPLLLLIGLVMTATALSATDFPKAAEYTIVCHPAFQVTVGDTKEIVTTNATVVVRASDPYLTAAGTRRVDLKIVSWKADGVSQLLGGPLKFRMIESSKPLAASFAETNHVVTARSGRHDFPARAQFVVPYEVETPFGTVSDLTVVVRGPIGAFPPAPEDIFKMEGGDTAKVMAQLLPAPLSSMSASGRVAPVAVSVDPVGCREAKSAGIRKVSY